MKFLCVIEFAWSRKNKFFNSGVIQEFTEQEAEQLIELDKKKPLGALSFFAPADEDAVKYIAAKKKKIPAENPVKKNETETTEPKPPTKPELIAEAKSLGIKGADRMSAGELKQVIEAVKKEQPVQVQE